MKISCKVDQHGRVLIPVDIRKRMDLKCPCTMLAELRGDVITLTEKKDEEAFITFLYGRTMSIGLLYDAFAKHIYIIQPESSKPRYVAFGEKNALKELVLKLGFEEYAFEEMFITKKAAEAYFDNISK